MSTEQTDTKIAFKTGETFYYIDKDDTIKKSVVKKFGKGTVNDVNESYCFKTFDDVKTVFVERCLNLIEVYSRNSQEIIGKLNRTRMLIKNISFLKEEAVPNGG